MLKTPSVMRSFQHPARRFDVLVREHLDRRAAQPATVDDAGVIQLVRDDDVLAREDRGDRAGVCRKPALKDDDRLGPLEIREALLQLHVEIKRSGNRSDRPGPDAVSPDGVNRPIRQRRMCGEPEIVVRRQVDDHAVVDCRERLLRALQHAQAAVEPLLFQALDLGGQIRERVGAHEDGLPF
jgi:hypothetical protein